MDELIAKLNAIEATAMACLKLAADLRTQFNTAKKKADALDAASARMNDQGAALKAAQDEAQNWKTKCETMAGHPDVIAAAKAAKEARAKQLKDELTKLESS